MRKAKKMNRIFNTASIVLGVAGGIAAQILGAWDTVLCALLVIMVLDYITGVMKAVYRKELSSETGYKGILRKITVLVIVALANVVQRLTGETAPLREMVIMFYIANEGISVLENAAEILPNMPKGIKDILLQIRGNDDDYRN